MTTAGPLAIRRSQHRLRPDPRRVVGNLFVPGQEALLDGESRAGQVLSRIADLTDAQAAAALHDVEASFEPRHLDLDGLLDRHFELIRHRIVGADHLSVSRRRLIGAYFTQEYALQAAAICNPSLVPHPNQVGVASGSLRVVMSLRAIGEGHRSMIELRTGTVDAEGDVAFDPCAPHVALPHLLPQPLDRERVRAILRDQHESSTSVDFVIDALPERFDTEDLERALEVLRDQIVTRGDAFDAADHVRRACASSYCVQFDADSDLSQRVLAPIGPAESHGMEDARFVRFVDDRDRDGEPSYLATYTAYDGSHVAPHLLRTRDLITFTSEPLTGAAARNKGLAIFPRRIRGRYAALSRWNRDSTDVVLSDDLGHWDEPQPLPRAAEWWNLVQSGNCGSPIETEAGWIVLTHGVGPMRRYSIGVELLDLEDPTRQLGRLTSPLLTPGDDERDGYVPNVVYSCGGLVHAGRLVLPYGIGDSNIGVASIAVDDLLARLDG